MKRILAAVLVFLPLSQAWADSPRSSVRPEARPASVRIVGTASRAIDAATRLNSDLSIGAVRQAPAAAQPAPAVRRASVTVTRSLRPRLRPGGLITATARTTPGAAPRPAPAPVATGGVADAGFDRWVHDFRGRALTAGIDARTFGQAFRHAAFLPKVIERDRNQSEFTLSMGKYLGRAASDSRVTNGRSSATRHATTLAAIEKTYGVDRQVVAAIWGMESNYGTNRGDTHLISALATLAYEGRRGAFFEEQLIAALKILQHGDTTEDLMLASWAGAMGHTQFIPTSYQAFAVDFTDDGRRDIWSEDPTDALASTAAYLAKNGWIKGMPWGVEVRMPRGFDYRHGLDARMPSDWARLGVTRADGGTLRDHGTARLLLPAGAGGPAFLVFKNFDVIKRYNASDAYALGVGHLGDRIAGGGAFVAGWPEGERSLRRAEAEELQHLLTRKGFNTGGIDGRIGGQTKAAIRDYQLAEGIAPDGYPSVDLLQRLRRR